MWSILKAEFAGNMFSAMLGWGTGVLCLSQAAGTALLVAGDTLPLWVVMTHRSWNRGAPRGLL